MAGGSVGAPSSPGPRGYTGLYRRRRTASVASSPLAGSAACPRAARARIRASRPAVIPPRARPRAPRCPRPHLLRPGGAPLRFRARPVGALRAALAACPPSRAPFSRAAATCALIAGSASTCRAPRRRPPLSRARAARPRSLAPARSRLGRRSRHPDRGHRAARYRGSRFPGALARLFHAANPLATGRRAAMSCRRSAGGSAVHADGTCSCLGLLKQNLLAGQQPGVSGLGQGVRVRSEGEDLVVFHF